MIGETSIATMMQKLVYISMSLPEFQEAIEQAVRRELQFQKKELPFKEEEVYLSRAEVSKLLSVSLGSLSKYVKNGSIPAKRLNGKVIFLKSDVEASLKSIRTIKHSRKI